MRANKEKDILKTLLSEIDESECKRMHYRMGVAVKIAEALKKKGLNQKDLANKLGKKPAEISKWLAGNHNFTIDTLVDIQSVLDIKLINVEDRRFETIQALPKKTIHTRERRYS